MSDLRARWILTVSAGLTALEALAALVRLATIPADPKNDVLFGFSASRLGMLALLAGALGLFVLLVVKCWRSPDWRACLSRPAREKNTFLISGFILLMIAAACLAVLTGLRSSDQYSHYTRLAPTLYFAAAAALQAMLVLVLLRFGLHAQNLSADRPKLVLSAAILTVFLLLWAVVASTGLGLIPDKMAWGIPGVPLLFFQVVLIAGAALLMVFAGQMRPRSGLLDEATPRRLDLTLGLVIWLAAVVIWTFQPVILRCYFAPEPRAPNYESYPFSDAGYYEYVAQSLVIGEGFQNGEIVPRPLFILVLAVINAIGGPSYSSIVFLQTLLLAGFPVVLFFLGKNLHSRVAGIVIAILAILREINALAATPLTTVSNSRLILSDFPTALAIAVFTLLVFAWLRRPFAHRWQPLVVGGALGLLMLIRTQAALLAPFVLLLALVVIGWKQRLRWLEAAALFVLATVLVVTPWLWRNYRLTGRIVFDQLTQTVPLADRYSLNGPPRQLPGEDVGEYTVRLMNGVRQFALQHPDLVAGFVSAHFFNNEIHTLLVLPWQFKLADTRDTLVVKTAFWENWDGRIDGDGTVLLLGNLALISIGLAAAWRRWGWVGLVPLVINIAYAASNAVARNSGWRYMLPADWVSYFYAGIGLVQAGIWLFALLGSPAYRPAIERPSNLPVAAEKFPWRAAVLILAAFFTVGASLPLAEVVIPHRYPPQDKQSLLQEVLAMDIVRQTGISAAALQDFTLREDVTITKGRALYPRFYPADQGEPTNEWRAYEPQPYPRLAFLVLNRSRWNVNLRMERSPAYFPNSADVILIACRGKSAYDPALVVVLGSKPAAYVRQNISPFACPLPETR